MSHRIFTDEQEAKIAKLYQEKELSYPKLAQLYNTSSVVIRWAIKRQGGKPRHLGWKNRNLPQEVKEQIKSLYINGISQEKIGKQFHISQATIGRILREMGVSIRNRLRNRDGHGNWKGGRTKTTAGYVAILLDKDSPCFCMANSIGYALEHRLIMAQHLGRPLEPYETVHHKNGIRDDNQLENLELRMGQHGNGVILVCADCGSHNIQAIKTVD